MNRRAYINTSNVLAVTQHHINKLVDRYVFTDQHLGIENF